ncbi:MAG: nucleoside transporter C-terminal domain-containing protein [Burkholderiales bacterium]|nr:nucleoside transporter C-terminal domain-containing protein [Burkholderiales bacterium]
MSGLAIQGLCGFIFLIAIAFIFSENRKAINWRLVLSAFILQNILFLLIKHVPAVSGLLQLISAGLLKFMDYAGEGSEFVFGSLVDMKQHGFVFALVVVPTIVFFGSVISLFYFFGIMQRVIMVLAFLLRKTLKLSGVESLVVISDIFLGQSEGPMVIGPYVSKMTRSELACAFVAGLANLSGSTLGIYLSFLGGGDHAQEMLFAQSLLTATFMNAASAIVFAKIIFPETEYDKIMDAKDVKADAMQANSAIDAVMHGAFVGMKVGIAICAALLAIIPLVHAIDGVLMMVGDLININTWIKTMSSGAFDGFSLEFIFGLIFRFFAFFMGIAWSETLQVGSLLGQKVAINEFVAYMSLGKMKAAGLLSDNAVFISTFALASFSNFSSIGISMGAFSALAPGRQAELSKMGFKALFAAILAGFMTATVAGFWNHVF